jgi:Magnesium chelatase, subunit ChlI
MGTTESIFFADADDDDDGDELVSQRTRYPPPAPSRQKLPPPGGSHHFLSPGGPPVGAAAASPSASRRSRISRQQQQQQQRPRPVPQADEEEVDAPTLAASTTAAAGAHRMELSGILLGPAGSGKSALLKRLQGKEPNFSDDNNNNNDTPESIGQDEDVEEMAVVEAPYRPPTNAPVFHDQIRLRVEAAVKLPSPSKRHATAGSAAAAARRPFDFYVIVIDPRTRKDKVERYLTATTEDLNAPPSSSPPPRPLCLCLLRNFRDLLGDDDNTDDDADRRVTTVSESDLTSTTLQILDDHLNSSINSSTSVRRFDPDGVVLQCTDTSLLNCYGLGQLHHFIYQSYLRRHRSDLHREMELVTAAQARARQVAPVTVPYSVYCADIERLVGPRGNNDNNNGSGGGNGDSRASRREGDDETIATATTAASSSLGGGGGRQQQRRTVMPLSQEPRRPRLGSNETSSTILSVTQPQSYTRDALEAFLESEDDDDDDSSDEDGHDKPQPAKSSGSEDDEEYFYDESKVVDASDESFNDRAISEHGELADASKITKKLDEKNELQPDETKDRHHKTTKVDQSREVRLRKQDVKHDSNADNAPSKYTPVIDIQDAEGATNDCSLDGEMSGNGDSPFDDSNTVTDSESSAKEDGGDRTRLDGTASTPKIERAVDENDNNSIAKAEPPIAQVQYSGSKVAGGDDDDDESGFFIRESSREDGEETGSSDGGVPELDNDVDMVATPVDGTVETRIEAKACASDAGDDGNRSDDQIAPSSCATDVGRTSSVEKASHPNDSAEKDFQESNHSRHPSIGIDLETQQQERREVTTAAPPPISAAARAAVAAAQADFERMMMLEGDNVTQEKSRKDGEKKRKKKTKEKKTKNSANKSS